MHKQVTVIEPGWGPNKDQALYKEISEKLWPDRELGHNSYVDTDRDDIDNDEFWDDYPAIKAYVLANNIQGDILIHWDW